MDVALLTARLLLAGVFGIAGVAKLADLSGSSRALVGFGVPERLARPGGVLLPLAEILIALALIPRPSAWWGSICAAALLAIFVGATAYNLMLGRSPECHCFGQLHSKPASWSTVARNSVLLAIAGLIVAAGRDPSGATAWEWLAAVRADPVSGFLLFAAELGVILMLSVLLLRILHQQGAIATKLAALGHDSGGQAAPNLDEGLPVGAPAPGFDLADSDGERTSLDSLLTAGKPVLLLFVSATCPPCLALLPLVKDWDRDHGNEITLVLLCKGTSSGIGGAMNRYGARSLLFIDDSDTEEVYRVNWTPGALIIGADGRIASRVVYGDENVRTMVAETLATLHAAAGEGGTTADPVLVRTTLGVSRLAVGDPAPDLRPPDVGGPQEDLVPAHGQATLLLFWDTHCRFCQDMIADLKHLEAHPPIDMPRMTFIVSGNAEMAKAVQGSFDSPTILDPKMEVAPRFGSHNTPSAVLIDRRGRIASSLAIGASNILTLAGVRRSSADASQSSD